VGIILAFLAKMGERQRFKQVYLGIVAAVITSIVFALVFNWVAGGFSGQAAEIFEGITTLIAAGLLTTMIIWMERKGPTLRKELEDRAAKAISVRSLGILSIVFIAVVREGVETVIFLFGIPSESINILLGASLGFIVAIGIAFIYFVQARRINIRTFFQVTSIILIIFAAGMLAYGIHELQEAGLIPVVVEHVWDVNFILDEKSPIGQILKGLLGYNGNPSLIEITAYLSYIIGIVSFFVIRSKRRQHFLLDTKTVISKSRIRDGNVNI